MSSVCVIDDDDGVRSALGLLLRSAGHQVAGFASAEAYLEIATGASCVLIVDVNMPPGMGGIELLQELGRRGRLPPVIVLTGQADVPLAVQAMKCGALDFLEKPFKDDALLGLIDRAGTLLDKQRGEHAAHAQAARALASLTPREHQIMACIVKGQPNKVIAIDLGISERTVEIHRGRVMKKLGARSVAELVQLALQHAGGGET